MPFLSNTYYYSRMFTTCNEEYLFNCNFSSPCLSIILRVSSQNCISAKVFNATFLYGYKYYSTAPPVFTFNFHVSIYLFFSLYPNATCFVLLNNLKIVGRSILLFRREFFKVCTFFCSSFFQRQVKKYLRIMHS